ncbi:regulator of sigma E protease [Keratinibaculum paraultunense]|uniref:Zinc metalloprotease n=1 Tax=Keratinibaculum paraultunense TaxID=1278232 RepID=A0A4R3KZY4_9FIRM|nr:RIP metalloprotease RseP [Keratinibaculum paraultunense]QQY80702.1 RIP metalloprotease RseP [Keratinibaculum paraultunense]TCS89694.1 regulator of sigma E protease [Keratinibaculum paraultunense]
MLTIIAAIFVFLMVILFHEFGHFIVAKTVGIKVNEFSIGMGPKILQKTKGETKYTIRILPIGGYVSMEGEDEKSNDPRSFNNVSPLSRIAVVAAGAIMNFILAIIVFSIVSYSVGMPSTTVYKTLEGSPAEEVGILSGDQIISINGEKINSWDEISEEISKSNPEEYIDIVILRKGKTIKYNLKPEISEENRVIIGIEPKFEKSFLLAIKGGFQKTGYILKLMFEFIKMAFRGKVSTKDLSGPVGVIYTIGETAKYGIIELLYLLGFISVNLGFFNLLPIPALDGSRIVFLVVEMIRGKPIDPEKEGFIHFIGFVLLIALMIVVTYSDIIRFNLFRR